MAHAIGNRPADPIRAPSAAAALLLVVGFSLAGTPGPALADDGSPASDSKYYASTVTGVQPAVPGLDVRIAGDGWVTLSTSGEPTITVIGYAGEEYLRIGPGGALENTAALTSSINAGAGLDTFSAAATVTAAQRPAHWVKRSDRPSFTWRDYRVRWTDRQRPSIVARDLRSEHEVFSWALPLRSGDQPVQVLGQVRWTGVPLIDTGRTVALAVLAALIGVAAWLVRRRRGRATVPCTARPAADAVAGDEAWTLRRRGSRDAG